MNYASYPGVSLNQKNVTLGNEILPKNSIVVITGAHMYSTNFSYYQIAYRGRLLYVYRDHVTFDDNTSEFYKSLLNADTKILDSLKARGIRLSKLYFLKDKLRALKFIESCQKKGLLIAKRTIYDESEVTNGTGFNIDIVNLSKKTIKYITFSIQGYNAVNDKVSAIKELKGIGPIEENQPSSYNFEYVWFTDIVTDFKLVSIKIQYMDGTIKMITDTNSIFDENGYLESYLNNFGGDEN